MAQEDLITDLTTSGVPARVQLQGANDSYIKLLPTEILLEIFQVLAVSPLISWRKRKGCVKWLVVNQVCRHWYDTATTSPTLWQIIDVYTDVNWLKLCLDRSGGVTVDVRFHNMETANSEDAKDLVVRHISRISKLYVLPEPDQFSYSHLRYLRGVKMPMLKEFNDSGGTALDITKSHHPALEVLRAEELDIDWGKLPYEHLRVLDLTSCEPQSQYDDRRIPSFDAFLQILASFQELEELKLSHSIPLQTPVIGDEQTKADYWRTSRIVSLPHLRKFESSSFDLTNGPTDVFAILSHLRLPRRASVKIWIGLDVSMLDNFRGLLGLQPQDPDAFPFLVDATSAAICYITDEMSIVASTSGTTFSVTYKMCVGGFMKDAYDPDAALSHFCTLFSCARLTELHLTFNPRFNTSLRTFRTFSCLRDLTIELCGRRQDFNCVLSALLADAETQDHASVVMPALHTLWLVQAPWSESTFEDIASCLEGRTMRNAAKLSLLTIEVAPGTDNPDDTDYEDMLGDLEPFVAEDADVFCYNA